LSGTVLRLVPLLLHFSTLCWFLGGLALVAASCCLDGEARLATGMFVGAFYLYGALGNLWATRGRHPGWMLMAAALVLIASGLGAPAELQARPEAGAIQAMSIAASGERGFRFVIVTVVPPSVMANSRLA
jgi:hypothetical protein